MHHQRQLPNDTAIAPRSLAGLPPQTAGHCNAKAEPMSDCLEVGTRGNLGVILGSGVRTQEDDAK